MEIIDLFLTGQTSDNLTLIKHGILFTDDIAKISLENIEYVVQSIRQTRLIIPQPATVPLSQEQGTTITLNNTTGRTIVPTEHHPATTNHLRSTADDENYTEEVLLEPSRRNNQRRTTSHTNRKTSHSNVRSNSSSCRSSRRNGSFHLIKHEYSTDIYSSASGDLGATTDEEGQPSCSNHRTTSEILFFLPTKGAKHPEPDSIVLSDERCDRLMSYCY